MSEFKDYRVVSTLEGGRQFAVETLTYSEARAEAWVEANREPGRVYWIHGRREGRGEPWVNVKKVRP